MHPIARKLLSPTAIYRALRWRVRRALGIGLSPPPEPPLYDRLRELPIGATLTVTDGDLVTTYTRGPDLPDGSISTTFVGRRKEKARL